tara:strand:- start:292 stop:864 length:573 start_codon:yes stop_codon:yes gene_type:complete
MINAWSLLHDELYGDEPMIGTATNKDYNDFWENDGISMVGNPFPSAMSDDTITFSPTTFGAAQSVPYENFMGEGEDHISFDTGKFNLNVPAEKNNSMYKYNEEEILKELKDYIVRTYNQHYSAGDDKIQTLDLIEACGDGEAFCRSNILKYASRYDKKGTARRDIMKILHYAVLLMHFNDKNAQNETYPQ